jgi:acetolactate synthase-1/2/3 large subunit
MGLGIPAVIGACLAAGGRRTVSLDGDGGFWMNIQDLETVRRLNLPAKFFVLNNNGYGSIRATQGTHFGGFMVGSGPDSGLTLPDTRGVCAAFGVNVSRLTSHENIRERVRDVLEAPGPAVCEVMVSPQQTTSPRLMSHRLPDGRMASKPLEDLWPFLPREEFLANMLIPPIEE